MVFFSCNSTIYNANLSQQHQKKNIFCTTIDLKAVFQYYLFIFYSDFYSNLHLRNVMVLINLPANQFQVKHPANLFQVSLPVNLFQVNLPANQFQVNLQANLFLINLLANMFQVKLPANLIQVNLPANLFQVNLLADLFKVNLSENLFLLNLQSNYFQGKSSRKPVPCKAICKPNIIFKSIC